MMLSEFGSTGIEEMSVFQALSAGNGTNPFRSAPGPVSMPAHVPLWATLSLESESKERPMRIMICGVFITLLPSFCGQLKHFHSSSGYDDRQLRPDQSEQVCWVGLFSSPG